jgi:parvulin-like peptidyl-prolyl isomerase
LVIQQLVSEVAKASQPTEAEAKTYFDAHAEEFSRPERVRVALLEFGAADAAAITPDLAKIRRAKEPERTKAFNTLVATKSTHEPSRAQDGDLGPRTTEELKQLFSSEVAAKAFGLQVPGEISATVATARGQVVLRLIGRQPEERKTFEVEKGALLGRLAAERRLKGVDELVAKLRKSAKVMVNDKAIERLDVKPPSGPLLGSP